VLVRTIIHHIEAIKIPYNLNLQLKYNNQLSNLTISVISSLCGPVDKAFPTCSGVIITVAKIQPDFGLAAHYSRLLDKYPINKKFSGVIE